MNNKPVFMKYTGEGESEEVIISVNQPLYLQQWIPCSERMPEKDMRDIWCCADSYAHHGYHWDGKEFVDDEESYRPLPNVTHWMPMQRPEPPQEPTK